MFTERLLYIK